MEDIQWIVTWAFLMGGVVLAQEPRSSEHYRLREESSVSAYGQRAAGAHVLVQMSANSGEDAHSTHYSHGSGHTRLLTHPAGFGVSVPRDPIPEDATTDLWAGMLDDDGWGVQVEASFWAILRGPLREIGISGRVITLPVSETLVAEVEATWGDLRATGDFLVADTNPDNFAHFAADGLPDAWQLEYFALDDPLVGPLDDPDGDGLNNQFEFLTGYSPADGASAFDLLLASDAMVELSKVMPGRTYRLYRSTDLQSWEDTGAEMMSNSELWGVSLTDPNPPEEADSRIFYLIEVED